MVHTKIFYSCRTSGPPYEARRTVLSDRDAVQANIHGASMPCLPKVTYMRGFQGSAPNNEASILFWTTVANAAKDRRYRVSAFITRRDILRKKITSR